MRVGIQLPEVERVVRWPEIEAMARSIDAGGFDAIWVGEHLLYREGDTVAGPWEAWTTLAAVAAVTERVTLGPLVAAVPFHHPAVLAKRAATLHEISGGRLVMAVGAGWNRTEFEAFGLPYQRRVDRFEDSIGVIRRLLRGEEVTHSSEFVTLDRCRIVPLPETDPPPFVIGSNGKRMLSSTLPWADGWNSWFEDFDNDPRRLVGLIDDVDDVCRAVGRDPAEIDRSVALLFQFGPPGPSPRGSHPIRGSDDEMAETLAAVEGCGVDEVQLVVDPITLESIEAARRVVAVYRAG